MVVQKTPACDSVNGKNSKGEKEKKSPRNQRDDRVSQNIVTQKGQ
jgi:hypothetical protein